jgi:hypothetical protein
MKTITVTIKGGAATVETEGFTGTDCLKETAALEKALGATTGDVKTAEYRRTAPAARHVRQGQ